MFPQNQQVCFLFATYQSYRQTWRKNCCRLKIILYVPSNLHSFLSWHFPFLFGVLPTARKNVWFPPMKADKHSIFERQQWITDYCVFFFVFSVFSPIGGNEKRYTHTQVNFTMTPNLISVVFDWLIYLLTKIEWKLAKKENEFLRGEETIRIFCVPYLAKQITAQPQLCTPLRHATQCSMLILQKCNKNENGK